MKIRKVMHILTTVLAFVMLLTACAGTVEKPTGESKTSNEEQTPAGPQSLVPKEKIEGSSLYVKKVEDLPDDFILGMDISSVLSEEKSGVKYYDFEGKERDLFEILAENGVTHIRVRIWNDPFTAEGKGYGGGNCDIEAAVTIGRRAAAVGMKTIADFHYSDFWADPAKQMVPKAWKNMDIAAKAQAVYEYTADCLKKLKNAGADVAMVQIGNETNGSICGEKTWFNMADIFAAGSKAVRETLPDALVAVHFANPEKVTNYADYASKLKYYDIDYDVFASSYYPFWHGTLDNLGQVLTNVADTYGKKTMVMETSYAFTDKDTDFSGNTISGSSGITKDYPFTVQGQANCFRNVVDTVVHKAKNGIGVVYWEGAWITVGNTSWEENSRKWEEFGSGWASSYASEYDPQDAGKYYGGSAVDNQAFFDEHGKALESLRVFNLVRYGNEVPARVDAIEDTNLVFDLNGEIILPSKVNAVMTDDSKQEVDVVWNVTEDDVRKMKESGAAKYSYTGAADGREAVLNVSMVEFNFLENYSFETGDLTGWVLTDLKKANELYVEDKATDSLTGNRHMHFWSSGTDSVEFTLEQTPADLPAGSYKFTISIMGGDGGETEIYAYAKIGGEIVKTAPLEITYYNEWHTATIGSIAVGADDVLTVGIYVKCAGAGNGAWGKIDDALLNSEAATPENG